MAALFDPPKRKKGAECLIMNINASQQPGLLPNTNDEVKFTDRCQDMTLLRHGSGLPHTNNDEEPDLYYLLTDLQMLSR